MNRWLPRCSDCKVADAHYGTLCDECRTKRILRVVLPPKSPHDKEDIVISELRSPWPKPKDD